MRPGPQALITIDSACPRWGRSGGELASPPVQATESRGGAQREADHQTLVEDTEAEGCEHAVEHRCTTAAADGGGV